MIPALALAIALVGCTHATSARRTLPSSRPHATASAPTWHLDACGTYPDMAECQEGSVP